MRKSAVFLSLLAALGLLFLATVLDTGLRSHGAEAELSRLRDQARRLRISDLCLFTEARYTRHPSQADRHSAFQDHPLAMEHFPSGSLIPPPQHLHADYARLP